MTLEVKPYRLKGSTEIVWHTELRIRYEHTTKEQVRTALANWSWWQKELVDLPAEEVASAVRMQVRLHGLEAFEPVWEGDDKEPDWTWVNNHMDKIWKETL
jgi:hypothetical protein